MDYKEFLENKHITIEANGFEVAPEAINLKLFTFQRDIVRWALGLGRAAMFEECGLGKTPQQLEWSKHVAAHTGLPVLILAPLAVSEQTIREGAKFGIDVFRASTQDNVNGHAIYVTNYERLHHFDLSKFGGLVLDESSILKSFTGKIKRRLIEAGREVPYVLACTATPSPNDHLELGNHAEFLGVMNSNEMIARWFINNSKQAGDYRLKKHAEADYWQWVTSWAVCISRPGDLGDQYDMPDFELPELLIHEHSLSANEATIQRSWDEGKLLPDDNPSSTTMHKVKRESLNDRVERLREIMQQLGPDEPVLIWCDTNYEADALVKALPDAFEVRGSEKPDAKEGKLLAFADGRARVLITKPDIAGFGMNYQHCAHMIFVGVSYSFEKTYQALRRSYRFGQTRPVNAHLIYTEGEGNIMATLKQKQDQHAEMQSAMNSAMREHGLFRNDAPRRLVDPGRRTHESKLFAMEQGDCVQVVGEMPDNSIDFSVYSPPYASIYLYSDGEADMGNNADMPEFLAHYEYLLHDLYRVTKPGRLTAVHLKDLPLYKSSSEWFGIEDFSGMVSWLHRRCGWVFHSRITIWKDPVDEMEKTNSHGLLHKNFTQRTQVCRVGLPDYLLLFVKPDPDGMGEDVKQIRTPGDYIGENAPHPHEYLSSLRQRKPAFYPGTLEQYNYSISVWQRYASPVWFDIRNSHTLNYQVAKDSKDEKHIAPMPLDVAMRAVDIWTNPGELVLSPFAGIGTEVYSAVKMGRRGVGVELKPSYFDLAVKHCTAAEIEVSQVDLFEWAATQEGK